MRDHTRHRPNARAIGVVLAVAASLLLGSGPAHAFPVHGSAPRRAQIGAEAWQLFQATNQSRGRFDVPKLTLDRAMSRVARRHSAAMARAGQLFHTSDVDMYLNGVTWRAWGENVGYTPGDVASMEQAFMHSAPHRTNILNRAFRHVAIGAVRVGGTLWVTVFFYG